ncbi:3-hydroxyacyl-CoA dehydrogenase family protein [Candidatus Aerophobetes bacterium]|nr:3-hydroxyacyl-CoA dehydrogenase family protein [Candidatus Aerophobetes bacterium]
MKNYIFRKAGIVGAGVMGSGIAQVFAQEGFLVILNDLDEDILNKAKERIKTNLFLLHEEGMLSGERLKKALQNLSFSSKLSRLKDVDIIIEAIPEKIELKRALFQKLDEMFSSEVILATNTSGISISLIASVTENPQRVIGMHWWNPPYIIPVVEVIKGEKTGTDIVEAVCQLVVKLNKKPVLVKKDIPGFLGNRMQYALMREAVHLLEENVASAEDIDTMVKAGFGFKFPVIGPLETIDMAGMDIFYNVSKYLYKELDASPQPQKLVEDKVDREKLGMKSGEGFYSYKSIDSLKLNQERVKKYVRLLKELGYCRQDKEV